MKVSKKVTRNGPDIYSWRDMVKGSVIVIGAFSMFYVFIMFVTGGFKQITFKPKTSFLFMRQL